LSWGKRLDQVREGQQKAEAQRRQLLGRLQAKRQLAEDAKAETEAKAAARRTRFAQIDVAATLDWTRRFLFMRLDDQTAGPQQINRSTQQLIEAFLITLRDRTSRSILQWPRGQNDVSMVHPLAMLGVLCATQERTTGQYTWCPAVRDFRTLYYPWRGSGSSSEQAGILLERRQLLKRNQFHVTRAWVNEPDESPQLKLFHDTLAHLHNLKVQDDRKPHLAHPTLAEIYPMFGALGGEGAPRPFAEVTRDLFGRVEYGAGLTRMYDARAGIVDPRTAPFAFFGLCARAPAAKVLSHRAFAAGEGRLPDICLLDLGAPGLRRLGHAWEETLADFVTELRRLDPEVPILAVTHDSYVLRRLDYLLGQCGLEVSQQVHSHVLFRATDDPFSADPPIGDVSEVGFKFHSVAGNGVAALAALSEAARACSDPSRAGALRFAMGSVRRSMSLPCGMDAAYTCLTELEDQAAAEAFLERRSAGTVLATIRAALDDSTGAGERAFLEAAERAVRRAYEEFAADTPIGSLLAEIAAVIARKSSRSLVVFNTETERQLGERRLLTDPAIGEQMRKKLASNFLRLASTSTVNAALADIENSGDRNSWKRVVLVTPTEAQLSILLGRSWLPEEIAVVSDRDFVVKLASTYRHLARHPDFAGDHRIGARLGAAAKAARLEGEARDVAPADLELDLRFNSDHGVIDLTGGDDDGERGVLEIDLESGRKIRVRPAGLIIRHNRRAEINVFERAVAREIQPGEAIVVPDATFVQEARNVLPVRVLAQGWIDIFHSIIEAALPRLPGESLAAKARNLTLELAKRGARQVHVATAADWLRVEDHKRVAKEQLRPHAPAHRREFEALMDVLGQRALAEKIWKEGILPLRIDRRRAGVKMAQAFASVLVDPHGGAAGLHPEIRGKIATLRRRALEHVDGIVACRLERSREGTAA
jgi:hypothetical protein